VICLRNTVNHVIGHEFERAQAGIAMVTLSLLCFLIYLSGAIGIERASGQSQPTNNQEKSVRGTVLNAATNQPISRALVLSGDNRFAALTDSEGHFEFESPDTDSENQGDSSAGPSHKMRFTGSAWLTARKPGFLDDPTDRRVFEGTSGGDLTITLMPEALIKGRATLSSTDAAAGVNVQIFSKQVQDGRPRWIPAGMTRTNSSGEFRFAELRPGSYKLVTHEFMDNDPVAAGAGAQSYGFPPVYFPNAADLASASTIQLTAGQTVQVDLSLTGHQYFPVRIPVMNAEAGAGIAVTVSLRANGGPGYSLGYNAEKQRIEGSLPTGNYQVEAASFGPNSMSGQTSITVANAPFEGLGMVLSTNSSVTLNVEEEFTASDSSGFLLRRDASRSFPVRGPRVYLQANVESADDFEQQRGGTIRPPSGPNDDSLVLENLQPGRYWLRLYSSRGYVASATLGGVDLLHQPLVVGAASNIPIEIKMRDDGAQLEGSVTGAARETTSTEGTTYAGSWTPPAWVYCVPLPDSPGQFQQLGVSADGTFNSQMMAPGTYRALAFKRQQPNLAYRDAESMRTYEGKGQTVHLSPGQKSNLQVQIISSSE